MRFSGQWLHLAEHSHVSVTHVCWCWHVLVWEEPADSGLMDRSLHCPRWAPQSHLSFLHCTGRHSCDCRAEKCASKSSQKEWVCWSVPPESQHLTQPGPRIPTILSRACFAPPTPPAPSALGYDCPWLFFSIWKLWQMGALGLSHSNIPVRKSRSSFLWLRKPCDSLISCPWARACHSTPARPCALPASLDSFPFLQFVHVIRGLTSAWEADAEQQESAR